MNTATTDTAPCPDCGPTATTEPHPPVNGFALRSCTKCGCTYRIPGPRAAARRAKVEAREAEVDRRAKTIFTRWVVEAGGPRCACRYDGRCHSLDCPMAIAMLDARTAARAQVEAETAAEREARESCFEQIATLGEAILAINTALERLPAGSSHQRDALRASLTQSLRLAREERESWMQVRDQLTKAAAR